MREIIYKQILKPGNNKYLVASDASFVKVAWQDGDVVVWYRCKAGEVSGTQFYPNKEVAIGVWPTGYATPAGESQEYLGSAVNGPGGLVFHAFLVTEQTNG